MKLQILLHEDPKNRRGRKFKSLLLHKLLSEYLERIERYGISTEVSVSTQRIIEPSPQQCVWVCHGGIHVKPWSSQQVATRLGALREAGVKSLVISIGDASGWNDAEVSMTPTRNIWSFGALTLPHELAAVVAAEQLYRAMTILKGEPYHIGHDLRVERALRKAP